MAWGPDGKIYFSRSHVGSIVSLTVDGRAETVAVGLRFPMGVAVDLLGNVYTVNNRLHKGSRDGVVSEMPLEWECKAVATFGDTLYVASGQEVLAVKIPVSWSTQNHKCFPKGWRIVLREVILMV